jgi:sulfide dehydrogenase [flavocytochrome c] flavoprotein subunit
MNNKSRRNFLKLAATAPAGVMLTQSGLVFADSHGAAKGSHVVIIGGGFGGATAAKYIKKFDPNVKVTLIEGNKSYTTCPGSNWVIAGLREIDSITFTYDKLQSNYGIEFVNDWVTKIDPEGKKVSLKGGKDITYDRLIVSPGISLKSSIEGYDEAAHEVMPHAWKAGPQTTLLRDQLHSMKDGGTFIIAPPPNPFRCPPGPPERISMVAHYLKENKPKSKILILDAKEKFSKQGLFEPAWKELYGYGEGGMIEYVPGSQGGKVTAVDTKNMSVMAGDLDEVHKGDVVNVIPEQEAGEIAKIAGLTDDSGWCPVDHQTWESTIHKNIHVIGDAAIQAPLPKSGYAANSEAKVCAANVVALLQGKDPIDPSWVNTCYSLVAPQYGISVAMVYDMKDGKVSKVKGSGGLSKADDNSGRAAEAVFAQAWYTSITNDMFT